MDRFRAWVRKILMKMDLTILFDDDDVIELHDGICRDLSRDD